MSNLDAFEHYKINSKYIFKINNERKSKMKEFTTIEYFCSKNKNRKILLKCVNNHKSVTKQRRCW